METSRLVYFCAVVETGSLSKASELLKISHSGISKALSLLQKEIGFQLLLPQGRGLSVSPEGLIFYHKAKKVLEMLESFTERGSPVHSALRIGLSEVIGVTCARHIAREIAGPLRIQEIDVGDLEKGILEGQLDFGIAFVPQPQPQLDYLKIGKIVFNSYAHKNLLASGEKELPYIVPHSNFPSNPMGYKMRDGWPFDVKRSPQFFVDNFSVASSLLLSAQGAAYCPDFYAKQVGEVLVKVGAHKRARSEREVFLVKLANVEETQEMKKVAKVIRKVCCHRNHVSL